MNEQIFATTDDPDATPVRDLIGYGEHPPRVKWEGDARVAVQVVVNYEEGSERTFAMGDGVNDVLGEYPLALSPRRDLRLESEYEYGPRAGIWRLFRIFEAAGIPVTFFAAAVALERNPAVGEKIAKRGDETVAHGYRWIDSAGFTEEEERESIRRAVESIARTTGKRPVGWLSRGATPKTRELLVEEGGFEYDCEAWNDDLPFWTRVNGTPHLVMPYSGVFNDMRFVYVGPGYGNPGDFFEYLKWGLDRLRNDGDDVSRMMSVGLHPRTVGNPARADAVARFIAYAQECGDVWIARRCDIAASFKQQYPAEVALGAAAE